jgi:integrase/recombinase XerD
MKDNLLNQLVVQAIAYLKSYEYSAHTTRHHASVWNSLVKYARRKGVSTYTLELGMTFIEEHYGLRPDSKRSKYHVSLVRSVRMLHDILQTGVAEKRYTCFSPVITQQHIQLLKLYEKRQKEHGLSSRTVANKVASFNNLLLFLERSEMTDISRLNPSDVYAYLKTLTPLADSTRERILYALRDALRFLLTEGLVEQKFAGLFSRIATHSKDPIPSVYSVDEITKMLACVDRDSRIGKRDYAILLLAARLGMRAGDIHRLQIGQIKWNQDCIAFVQQKTNTPLVLPLLKDVKLALLDYLKNSRPASAP